MGLQADVKTASECVSHILPGASVIRPVETLITKVENVVNVMYH